MNEELEEINRIIALRIQSARGIAFSEAAAFVLEESKGMPLVTRLFMLNIAAKISGMK